ncbi:MAG: tetratricopeptide repeat protein [Treponema sp.]|nr:tetratricopeptide repeat protein [Treponema sp.]
MATNASSGSLAEGKRLFGLKRWDLALREFMQVKAERITPEESTELAYYLGLCYTKLGRYDDGLLYLEQVITAGVDPLRVYQCRMTLAYIYAITSRSRLAEFELGQLIKNGFTSAQLYTTLAYAAWMQKKSVHALELYEKALEIDENNTTALNGIGYILVDTDQDVMRGLRFCRKAVDRQPQNAAYLDSLGWAYYKNGNAPEARMWLRRALDLAPGQEDIRKHLRIIVEDMKS